ncbi:MAG: hypothetical protein R2854_03570 [Caldilineaceae bacterium]
MAIAAKKFGGGKKVKPIWQQQVPPITFNAPRFAARFQLGHARRKPSPARKTETPPGVKAQLLGANRLLTDICTRKPARFSSILQANGVTPC